MHTIVNIIRKRLCISWEFIPVVWSYNFSVWSQLTYWWFFLLYLKLEKEKYVPFLKFLQFCKLFGVIWQEFLPPKSQKINILLLVLDKKFRKHLPLLILRVNILSFCFSWISYLKHFYKQIERILNMAVMENSMAHLEDWIPPHLCSIRSTT